MTHTPGDEEWLLDEDDDFDPLESMEPIAGEPEAVAPPQGAPLETDAEWDAVKWLPTEQGHGTGYIFQRHKDAEERYAKVVFRFADHPPPHDKIQSAAGSAWRLETTRVAGRVIEAFYVRVPHQKTHDA